jgi:hypothetical protein
MIGVARSISWRGARSFRLRIPPLLLPLVFIPLEGRAIIMQHYDLESLALQAKSIVLAESDFHFSLVDGSKMTAFKVIKAFKGPLWSGQSILVGGLDSYVLDLNFESSPFGQKLEAQPKLDAGTFLFLDAEQDIVLSGVRVLSQGKVYRFEQWCNPGPYIPVPQGRNPDDVHGLHATAEPVDLATFEKDLLAAIRRASNLEAAFKIPDAIKRRKMILDLLGPALPFSEPTANTSGRCYSNLFASNAIDVFTDHGDVEGALEAVTRSWNVLGGHFRCSLNLAQLLMAAQDARSTIPLRSAALWLIENSHHPRPPGPIDLRGLKPLLADREIEIRRAVSRALGGYLQQERANATVNRSEIFRSTLKMLAEAWKIEEDPRVEGALLWGMSGIEDAPRLLEGTKKVPPVLIEATLSCLIPGEVYAVSFDLESLEGKGIKLRDWILIVDSAQGGSCRTFDPRGPTVEDFLRSLALRNDPLDWKIRAATKERRVDVKSRIIEFQEALQPGKHGVRLEAQVEGYTPRKIATPIFEIEVNQQ